MEKWIRNTTTGKWTNESGMQLGCGSRLAMKYGDDIEVGVVEYDENWNGGYYLHLDNGAGKLPMFGNTLYAKLG